MPTNIVLVLILGLAVAALLYARRRQGGAATGRAAKEGRRAVPRPALRRPAPAPPRPRRVRARLIPHATPIGDATGLQDEPAAAGAYDGASSTTPTDVPVPAAPVPAADVKPAALAATVPAAAPGEGAVHAPGWPTPGELARGLSAEDFDPMPGRDAGEADGTAAADGAGSQSASAGAEDGASDWAGLWDDVAEEPAASPVAVMTDANARPEWDEDGNPSEWSDDHTPEAQARPGESPGETPSAHLSDWTEDDPAATTDDVATYVWDVPVEDPEEPDAEAAYTADWPAEATSSDDAEFGSEGSSHAWEESPETPSEDGARSDAGQDPAPANAGDELAADWTEDLAAVRALAGVTTTVLGDATATIVAAADAASPVIVVMPGTATEYDLAGSVRRLEQKVLELTARPGAAPAGRAKSRVTASERSGKAAAKKRAKAAGRGTGKTKAPRKAASTPAKGATKPSPAKRAGGKGATENEPAKTKAAKKPAPAKAAKKTPPKHKR